MSENIHQYILLWHGNFQYYYGTNGRNVSAKKHQVYSTTTEYEQTNGM